MLSTEYLVISIYFVVNEGFIFQIVLATSYY